MDRLEVLRQIRADADLISVSQTTSSGGTAIGLGSASGRAILALGELALRGVETVNIWLRLRALTSQLRQNGKFSMEDVQDLLELQRIGLYTNNVRRKAWSLILVLLMNQGTQQLLNVLLPWRSVESELFLRQLAAHKLSGWIEITDDKRCIPEHAWDPRAIHITNSFHEIARAFLEKDPSILHDILDVHEFAGLLQPNFVALNSVEYQESALPYFLNSLLPWYTSNSGLPPIATFLTRFLNTGHPKQVVPVVKHIIESLRPFACPIPDFKSISLVLAQHPELARCTFIHPIFPFLLFARGLVDAIEPTRQMFTEMGLFEIIAQLCTFDFPEPEEANPKGYASTKRKLRRECCTLLATFDPTWLIELVRLLKTANVEAFYDIFPTILRFVPRGVSSESTIDIWAWFYNNMFDLMSSSEEFPEIFKEQIHDLFFVGLLDGHEEQLLDGLLQRTRGDVCKLLHELSCWKFMRWYPLSELESSDPDVLDAKFRSVLLAIVKHHPFILTVTYAAQVEDDTDSLEDFFRGFVHTVTVLASVIVPRATDAIDDYSMARHALFGTHVDSIVSLNYQDANVFAKTFAMEFNRILAPLAPLASVQLRLEDMELLLRRVYMKALTKRDESIVRNVMHHYTFHRGIPHEGRIERPDLMNSNLVENFARAFKETMSSHAPIAVAFVKSEDFQRMIRVSYELAGAESDRRVSDKLMDLLKTDYTHDFGSNREDGGSLHDDLEREYSKTYTSFVPFVIAYLKREEAAFRADAEFLLSILD